MQNAVPKLRQSSVFEKLGILSENLKILTSGAYLTVQFFCWNFACVFYIPLSKKGCVGFFLFYLDFELFAKIEKKTLFLHTRFFHFY